MPTTTRGFKSEIASAIYLVESLILTFSETGEGTAYSRVATLARTGLNFRTSDINRITSPSQGEGRVRVNCIDICEHSLI